jgi:glyoxylase-like metal-dependent hydrolase (beta-lactamase superfamily II)
MIQLGEMCLHLILESRTRLDGGGAFGLVPRALWGKLMPFDEENRVPFTQHCLLVQTGGRNILVDTGFGSKLNAKMREVSFHEQPGGGIPGALGRLGLTPDDIHLVIDTHLHNDHCGGNTDQAEDGAIIPAFPNAEYVVQRREFQDATHPNERTRATYLGENFVPLVETGQMRLLDGDTELAPGVFGVVTPGHTPGHMSVRLESGGQHALFACDMASFAIHFERLGWMTAYDVEPLITLETKRRWQDWALETGALLIFPHDSLRPMGRYEPIEGGKGQVVRVEEGYA